MTAFAKRMDGVSGSAIRELFSLLGDPEIISFGGGNPAMESFPVDTVRSITDEILTKNGKTVLQYGATEGYMPLRKAVLECMPAPKSLNANLDEILILSGSMQGLDLISKVYLDPGDAILVEAPTFLGALQVFNTFQANIVPVPTDEEGVIIEELETLIVKHHPKFFYCIPTFQNPTGKTLLVERRRRIAELASKYDMMIIEDDPYCDLRYSGTALPTIKSFDTDGHVILLNSFSKIISPGIRVGYAFGQKDIIRKLTVAKQGADTHTSNLTQAIAAEFLLRGLLPGHLERIIPLYAERLNSMLAAMDDFFPDSARYTRPEGGLFIWCELKQGIEVIPLFKKAVTEHKVAFVPGEHFFPDPNLGKNTLRLNFSAEQPSTIKVGIERLGNLLKTI